MSFWEDHPEAAGRLEALHADGLSFEKIGEILGCGKNAAVGKSRRMGLGARAPAINMTPEQYARRSEAIRIANESRLEGAAGLALAKKMTRAAKDAITAPKPVQKPPVEKLELPKLPVGPCCFPIGEPGSKGFIFCGDRSEPGRPYCLQHCRECYVDYRRREAVVEEWAA